MTSCTALLPWLLDGWPSLDPSGLASSGPGSCTSRKYSIKITERDSECVRAEIIVWHLNGNSLLTVGSQMNADPQDRKHPKVLSRKKSWPHCFLSAAQPLWLVGRPSWKGSLFPQCHASPSPCCLPAFASRSESLKVICRASSPHTAPPLIWLPECWMPSFSGQAGNFCGWHVCFPPLSHHFFPLWKPLFYKFYCINYFDMLLQIQLKEKKKNLISIPNKILHQKPPISGSTPWIWKESQDWDDFRQHVHLQKIAPSLGEMADSRAGARKVQDELGTSWCAGR